MIVFLDVGNILLDEDPLTYFSFCRHVAAIQQVRPDLSFEVLLAQREARALAGSAWPLSDVAATYLDASRLAEVWQDTARAVRARFDALSPVVRGAEALLDRLANRVRLGLIANQPRECRDRLQALGWLDRFDPELVLLGEEQGLAKPDARLFQRALERARVEPASCVMVGDRLDHDIAPASALGLATVWVRWPKRAAKGWPRADDDPNAWSYLRAVQRGAAASVARWLNQARPGVVVDRIDQIDMTRFGEFNS